MKKANHSPRIDRLPRLLLDFLWLERSTLGLGARGHAPEPPLRKGGTKGAAHFPPLAKGGFGGVLCPGRGMCSIQSLGGLGCALLLGLTGATHAAPPALDFNRDIRPVLSENCFYCHGQDANKRQAELRLDVRDDRDRGRCDCPE